MDRSLAMLKQFEGCVPWMYLDTAGKVTVGVGLMLADADAACALPFFIAGKPATRQQIVAEFSRIHTLPMGKLPGFYKAPSSPELAQQFVDDKLNAVLVGFESTLRKRLAAYDKLPDGVKMALLDMAYNLGPAGLLTGYPQMILAVESGAWARAATECARNGIGAERNSWTRKQILSAVVATIRAEVDAEAESFEKVSAGWFKRLGQRLRGLLGSAR